jgi:hypothetical protein
LPQAPQFEMSLPSFTQALPQQFLPGPQGCAHAAPLLLAPELLTLPLDAPLSELLALVDPVLLALVDPALLVLVDPVLLREPRPVLPVPDAELAPTDPRVDAEPPAVRPWPLLDAVDRAPLELPLVPATSVVEPPQPTRPRTARPASKLFIARA